MNSKSGLPGQNKNKCGTCRRYRFHVIGCLVLLLRVMLTGPLQYGSLETKTPVILRPRNPNRRTSLPKIVFGAVFRDTDARSRRFYKRFLRMAKAITSEYHVVIYENDSSDDTRDFLRKQAWGRGNSSRVTMLFEDNVTQYAGLPNGTSKHDNNVHKTARIARARNKVLDYVEGNFHRGYDYFAMVDMDMLCTLDPQGSDYDHNILKYVLLELHDEWDALSFRQSPYFDWWALRYPPMLPGNYVNNWEKKKPKGKNRFNMYQMEDMMTNDFQETPWPHGLLKVESAFALLSFYRMSMLNGTARYRGVDEEGVVDCEHVAFHADLIEHFNARIRISPLTYCKPGRRMDKRKNNTYKALPASLVKEMTAIKRPNAWF